MQFRLRNLYCQYSAIHFSDVNDTYAIFLPYYCTLLETAEASSSYRLFVYLLANIAIHNMLCLSFIRCFLTFALLLRSALCRPGQCFSGQSSCKDTQVAGTQDASTQTIEAQTLRGYQIFCPEHSKAVYLLLKQVFSGIVELQSDLDPILPESGSSPSPARDAFLQNVSPNVIKPLLQKISSGAKLKTPQIPQTIDEDAELRPGLSKVPGRPYVICATPTTARLYDHRSIDFYGYCTKPEFGRPLIYTESGDTIFLCPRFFEELRIWQGGGYYCPQVSPDGTSFWPQEIQGKPAQEWFDGWQHLVLFRELVKMYLGDRALTMRSIPQITEDWNECFELEGDAARYNPRNWVLWMAAVEQGCTEFPDPRTPRVSDMDVQQSRLNTTDLLSSYSNDSYTPIDIYPDASYLTPTRDSPRSGGSSRSGSNRGSPSRGSPPSLRLNFSSGNNTPSPDNRRNRASPAFNYPALMRQIYRLREDQQD